MTEALQFASKSPIIEILKQNGPALRYVPAELRAEVVKVVAQYQVYNQ